MGTMQEGGYTHSPLHFAKRASHHSRCFTEGVTNTVTRLGAAAADERLCLGVALAPLPPHQAQSAPVVPGSRVLTSPVAVEKNDSQQLGETLTVSNMSVPCPSVYTRVPLYHRHDGLTKP